VWYVTIYNPPMMCAMYVHADTSGAHRKIVNHAEAGEESMDV